VGEKADVGQRKAMKSLRRDFIKRKAEEGRRLIQKRGEAEAFENGSAGDGSSIRAEGKGHWSKS
jgi:hypothetical protein